MYKYNCKAGNFFPALIKTAAALFSEFGHRLVFSISGDLFSEKLHIRFAHHNFVCRNRPVEFAVAVHRAGVCRIIVFGKGIVVFNALGINRAILVQTVIRFFVDDAAGRIAFGFAVFADVGVRQHITLGTLGHLKDAGRAVGIGLL